MEGSSATNNNAAITQDNITTADEESESDAPSTEEIKFYLLQLYLILKPVIGCIVLSILWVKISNPPIENWSYG